MVTLLGASKRHFVTVLRLNLSMRLGNRGRYPIASGQIVVRVAADDVLTPPLEMLNEVIEPTSATAATLVFDLPPSTAKAAIRVSFQNESSELPLDVK